jgi:hypothetical protein
VASGKHRFLTVRFLATRSNKHRATCSQAVSVFGLFASDSGMYPSNLSRLVLGKLLLVAVAFVALVEPLAKELAPGIGCGFLVFYCLASLVGLLSVLAVASVCSLQFSQFILRMGGTDTQ